jgi:hypothetical protein
MKRFFNEKNKRPGQLTLPQLYQCGAAAGMAASFVFCKLYSKMFFDLLQNCNFFEFLFFIGPVEHVRTRKS